PNFAETIKRATGPYAIQWRDLAPHLHNDKPSISVENSKVALMKTLSHFAHAFAVVPIAVVPVAFACGMLGQTVYAGETVAARDAATAPTPTKSEGAESP